MRLYLECICGLGFGVIFPCEFWELCIFFFCAVVSIAVGVFAVLNVELLVLQL
jgi:hypothetical protein